MEHWQPSAPTVRHPQHWQPSATKQPQRSTFGQCVVADGVDGGDGIVGDSDAAGVVVAGDGPGVVVAGVVAAGVRGGDIAGDSDAAGVVAASVDAAGAAVGDGDTDVVR